MTPKEQLDGFIAKFSPEIAALAGSALAKMSKRFPTALQLVYANYNALVIGFGPTERASDAIFSIALYPTRVNLNFLQSGKSGIQDPHHLLQGSGSTNRFIPLTSPATLDASKVRELMTQAVASAKVPLSRSGHGRLIIKSVSAKQRPRRSASQVSVDDFINDLEETPQAVAKKIVSLVESHNKKLGSAIKWRQLTFCLDNDFDHWICAVSATKKAVALKFHFGSLLNDKHKVFTSDDSKFIRKAEIASVEDINEGAIIDLLDQATEKLPYFKEHWKDLARK